LCDRWAYSANKDRNLVEALPLQAAHGIDTSLRISRSRPPSVGQTFSRIPADDGARGLCFWWGQLVEGEVTISADLNLAYEPRSSDTNTVVNLAGEFCFGQNWAAKMRRRTAQKVRGNGKATLQTQPLQVSL
jgi:hypothetical protein